MKNSSSKDEDLSNFLLSEETKKILPEILSSPKYSEILFQMILDKVDDDVIKVQSFNSKYDKLKELPLEKVPEYLAEDGKLSLLMAKRMFSDMGLILRILHIVNKNHLESINEYQKGIESNIESSLENHPTFKWIKRYYEEQSRDTEKIDDE